MRQFFLVGHCIIPVDQDVVILIFDNIITGFQKNKLLFLAFYQIHFLWNPIQNSHQSLQKIFAENCSFKKIVAHPEKFQKSERRDN